MNRSIRGMALWACVLLSGIAAVAVPRDAARADDTTAYRSPFAIQAAPDGKTVYVTDRTSANVSVLDVANMSKRGEVALHGNPFGLALSKDGATLYVAEHGAGTVAVINTGSLEITSRIAVGKWPTAVATSETPKRLYVGNQDRDSISVIDLGQNPAAVVKEIPVTREPSCIAVSPDGQRVAVTNLMALGRGTDPDLAAELAILDGQSLAVACNVKLPPGSTMVPGVAIAPSGKYAYVVHGLGRFNLPITQLERGWVNTFGMSIIDIAEGTRIATVLLDDLSQGAADPHSIACSADGSKLWISHSGVHEISAVDIGLLHDLLEGKVSQELAALKDGTRPNIWVQIQQDKAKIADLENDLTALYIAGAIRRYRSGGVVPRGVALSPSGQSLFVANYFSGSVSMIETASGRLQGTISLGPQAEADPVRRGAIIFHDATRAFQRWHSCASCHANEGRIDGLRWDFLGDGIGNPKDTISLVHFDKTEPMNRRATMQKSRDCARNGLASTNMIVPTEQDVDDLYAYLISLRPVPSPHLGEGGKLTEAAERGKALFDGKAACSRCHPAPYFTDNKMHNVGVLSPNESDGRYDTPALLEAYRTAPYLHDGRALTLKDVLTTNNEEHRHGTTDKLTPAEIDDIVAYLQSL
ncbi:MAG: c-type cytochrome [Planctomycetes bacterium]|nr:c-type cytochrome [Planctomycetota bacterium]